VAPGAFATLQRRGPQGRVHIWGVISCKGDERRKWRGPKGRADALAIVVLWRKEDPKVLCLCNALAEEAIKRSAEARSAEALRKGEARRAEPTWHTLHAEARRAEGRGPKGRGEILRVVNLLGNGSEPDSGSPHVIMPKGVSQGTSTSRCRPLTVSVISRHTGVYYCLVKCLYCA